MEISIADWDEIRHKQRVADAVKAAEYGTTAESDSSGPETTEDKPRRKMPRGRYANRLGPRTDGSVAPTTADV